MNTSSAHPWNVTPAEAVAIQKELRARARIEPFEQATGKRLADIRFIAGCDVSLNLYSTTVFAGFVVLSYPDMKVVEHAVIQDEATFPYVPGLLSFREIPALVKAWALLGEKLAARGMPLPDLIMVDGQGVAHPRRLGIAAHLGIVLDMPAIGCAKSILTGEYDRSRPLQPGDAAPLLDRATKEQIGWAFQSKARSNPLIVSAGHKISQDEALDVVRACLKGYRLPEPTRQAHLATNEYRKKAPVSPSSPA